ncbi:hypothetical protein T02_12737 [Trichinella nativa]|uniref:Uncharacterized protein n=1 Tax=Trichinella nativa TaxID=6335 RepID=A0A0V1LL89_9BILA|nr:hypothetical protein T02_12737 [Trichinella nativa]KRZ96385.1 hypothetical protein T08_9937 [Trichinella sp. T8]
MSRETLIASLQRLASLLCVKSFGQCHISQTSTITLEWRFQYLLSLNHNIGAGLSQREVLDRRSASDSDTISLLLALSVGKAAYKAELIC